MTKLVITMDEGLSPVVERYEAGLKVGSRKVSLEGVMRSFIEDAPLKILFDVLINKHDSELESFLELCSEATDNGYAFITTLFNSLPDALMDKDQFSDLAALVIENASDESLPIEQLTSLIRTWANKIRLAPPREEDAELYKDLLQYFLGSAQSEDLEIQRDLLQTIYKYSGQLKEKNKIDKWVMSHIEHLPPQMFLEALQAKQSADNKLVLGFSSVPKNAAFVATTNEGTTYFYDIPKTKIRVKFQTEAYEDVGHPRLMFAISTKNDVATSVKLCAVKGKQPLTVDTPLFRYPYSNVFDNGDVCWSSWSEVPIDQIPMMFLSTANNSHLNSNTLELFKKYQGKNFPDTQLKPIHQTVYDWC